MLRRSENVALTLEALARPFRRQKWDAHILVVNGHPDPRPERYCAALSASYAAGAKAAGLTVRELTLGTIPDLASDAADDPRRGISRELESAFEMVDWATQLLIVFPLWLNRPPAQVQKFFAAWAGRPVRPIDSGSPIRSARLLVTMAMPAFAQRSASRRPESMISLPGIPRTEFSYIGSVANIAPDARAAWLESLNEMGRHGE